MAEIASTERSLRRSWPAWLVIAAYAAIAALTFDNYGITSDEALQARYGELVVDYVASGFRDTRFEDFLNLPYYGPLVEVWPALFHRVAGGDLFEIRHAFVAVAAIIGLIGVVAIGELLRRPRLTTAFAAIALLTMPSFYGHTFFNSKDIPFATAFTWAIYGLIRLPESARATIRYGVLTACALLVRVGAVVLFPLGIVAIALQAVTDRSFRHLTPSLAGRFALGAVIAWAVTIAFWPWAHLDPLHNPIEALNVTLRFAQRVPVLFSGEVFDSTALPRHYLVSMLAVTTPLPILMFLTIGAGVLTLRTVRRTIAFAELTVLLWLLVPLVAQFVLHSPTYDGTRHFLFVYPAIALVAATGMVAVIEVLRDSRLAIAGVVVTMLAVVPQMIALHPYEYVFFNAIAGGTAGAAGRYDTDYWGASLRESARWIAAHPCRDHKTRVVAGSLMWQAAAFNDLFPADRFTVHLLDNRRQTPPPAEFDYYMSYPRYGWETRYADKPLVFTVARSGAILGVVRGGCDQRLRSSEASTVAID